MAAIKAVQRRILSVWFEPGLRAGYDLHTTKAWATEVMEAQNAIWVNTHNAYNLVVIMMKNDRWQFGAGKTDAEKQSFDALLTQEFGETLGSASKGELKAWEEDPESTLSLLILCDQMSRNIHRGHSKAFALDTTNQAVTKRAMTRGFHTAFPAFIVRQFFYLPLMHAESKELQAESVRLYAKEAEDAKEQGLPEDVCEKIAGTLEFAHGHKDVVDQFGRFPTSKYTLFMIQYNR